MKQLKPYMKEIKDLQYKGVAIAGPRYKLAILGMVLFYGLSAIVVSLLVVAQELLMGTL
jgi:hypothetical protein